mmetsp:Transcript_29401/g.44446  ORF Transcript_29401/g.44446 Transcript_29401/m.44446 type:complete len:112 (+) Transcript_29401:5663-5998(+)
MSASDTVFSSICPDEYKQALQSRLEKTRALVISTSVCPACTRAKNLLERNNIDFTEVVLDRIRPEDADGVSKCVFGNSSKRFVPQVYLDQKKLDNGLGDLMDMQRKNQLKT